MEVLNVGFRLLIILQIRLNIKIKRKEIKLQIYQVLYKGLARSTLISILFAGHKYKISKSIQNSKIT